MCVCIVDVYCGCGGGCVWGNLLNDIIDGGMVY
jgi:hypothetical protein